MAKRKRSGNGEEEMRDINQRLRKILEDAPSDATAELEVHRAKNGYQGLLKVYSRQRKFIGGSRSGRFVEVIENLFREVRDQIKQWKSERNATLDERDATL